MSAAEPNLRVDAPKPPRPPDYYEWEITIQAPFAFDFLKLVRSLFRLPKRRHAAPDEAPRSRRGWYLHVFLYNLGRLLLILGMIPFTMLAFSYVATLPFLLMRAMESWIGEGAVAAGEEWRDADGWWDCRADYTDPNRATAAERPPIEITDRTCVRLLFEVSPSPDRIFVLSLDGIAVEGKPLRLPSIRFEKASGWLTVRAP